MFFILTHRALRHCFVRAVWHNTVRATVATLLLLAPHMASAQTETDFEKPPVLKATDLVSANLLKGAGAVTRDALGYEQERRELAKKLGVDPYTSNPILAKKLDEIAWVSFTAHLGVSAAMSVAVPGSMIITGVRTVDNLVWDTLRGDLIVRIETKLEELDDTTRQEGVHGQRLEHT